MDYIELYIPARSSVESEIFMAELADYPFESFEQEDTYLKAYIREGDLTTCRTHVDEYLHSLGVQCHFTPIETINWNKQWESNFAPVEVEGRCAIRAPFHEPYPTLELDIVIMPKMSFGTGHHATTYLMTAAIMEHDFKGLSGLDMGSGTGVLAIIAAKRGATHIDAVDIDEWAEENCRENCETNGVSAHVTAILGDASAIDSRSYDFILANINRNILLADMERYVATMHSGSTLIMSGILEKDIETICQKAESLSLKVTNTRTREGWAAIETQL